MAEPKVADIIKTIQSGGARELTLRGVRTPSGASFDEVQINNDEDARLFKEHIEGDWKQAPPAPAIPSGVETSGGKFRRLKSHGGLTSTRSVSYLEYLKTTHTKYQNSSERAVKMLLDICGDMPPDDYEPDTIDYFIERIKLLPLNPEKNKQHRDRWSKLNFKQLANEGALFDDIPKIKIETVNEHLAKLAGFFSFCFDRRYMGEPSPLLKRVKTDGVTKNQARRDPFSADDLVQIFTDETYKTRKLPHTFWPPLIALFTGARCNEIAQLYLDDVVNDDPVHPERWRFQIRIGRGRPDQRLKNKFANRSIPMHPRLIELGFLNYLEDVKAEGFDRVFPSLRWTKAAGYGDTVSDGFSTYLRKQVKITDPRKVFHSMRHYFCDQANNLTRHDPQRIFDITGHLREGEFYLTYARELHYPTKMEILMDIPLPTMKLPVYTLGMFTKNLKATKLRQQSYAKASAAIKDNHAKVRKGQAEIIAPKDELLSKSGVKPFSIKATRKRVAQPSGA